MHTSTTVRRVNKLESGTPTVRARWLVTVVNLPQGQHMQIDEQLIDLCWLIIAGLLTVRLLSAIFLNT